MKIAGYETHPAADLFPMMEEADLAALAADIKAHGLLDPVVLFVDGGERLVLDGRNRLRACESVGVAPKFEMWMGDGSPTEWVISRNLHRRHLTTSQRAMIAADLSHLFEQEAKARMVAGKAPEDPGADLRQGERAPKSAAKAAAALNVSPRSVEAALKVQREAPMETVAAVRRGEVKVSAAARALPAAKAEPKKLARKEEDWDCSITLTVPHSAIPAVERLLASHGFTGSASRNRKMKLHSLKALESAA